MQSILCLRAHAQVRKARIGTTDVSVSNPDYQTEAELKAALGHVLRLREQHVLLCEEAHRLRRTDSIRLFLEDKRKAKYDCWFQIHHYLARLGSWLRATSNVVQLSHNFADSLAACDVRDLPVDINNEQAPLVLERDPGKVLLRVCPNFKGTSIFYDPLAKLQGACELASQYRTHTQVPIPHAETKILHFFFVQGLHFARQDRYVGCSKPSCYSCGKYFYYHPARANVGRKHNNTWIKWSLPSPLMYTGGQVDRLSVRLMSVMADSVRNDIVGMLVANESPLIAMFDSTTGLTSSVSAYLA